jgi:hypothetical protein
MTRIPMFPHTAAWAIVAVLLVGLAAPQLCSTAHGRATLQQQAQVPSVEIVPDDRPDRRGYDESAFVDEMNSQPVKTRLVHR